VTEHEIYSTYAEWWELLVRWCLMVVPKKVAERAARHALARMFKMATGGHETTDGPYMASIDICYALVMPEVPDASAQFIAQAFTSVPILDEDLLCRIAKLYATVYHISYSANWGLQDVMHVQAMVRMHNPKLVPEHVVLAGLDDLRPRTHPLRCAVQAMYQHTHDDELICLASGLLWEEEEEKTGVFMQRELANRRRT
jgi:hypothetical protein